MLNQVWLFMIISWESRKGITWSFVDGVHAFKDCLDYFNLNAVLAACFKFVSLYLFTF